MTEICPNAPYPSMLCLRRPPPPPCGVAIVSRISMVGMISQTRNSMTVQTDWSWPEPIWSATQDGPADAVTEAAS